MTSSTLRNVIKLIPQFGGDYEKLPRFIKAVELAISSDEVLEDVANAAIKAKIIKHVILNNIDNKTYNKIKDRNISTVDELHKAMKEELLRSIEPENVLVQIYEIKQIWGETVEAYASKIKRLREKFEDSLENSSENVELAPVKAYNERLIIKSFIKNVRPELKTLLLSKEFATLDEAVKYAQTKENQIDDEEDLERNFKSLSTRYTHQSKTPFHEMGFHRQRKNYPAYQNSRAHYDQQYVTYDDPRETFSEIEENFNRSPEPAKTYSPNTFPKLNNPRHKDLSFLAKQNYETYDEEIQNEYQEE